jgi:hypothetical protein
MNEQLWYKSKDVVRRFGGTIGRDKVLLLMKSDIIKSYWIGRSICTCESAIAEFEARILNAKAPIEFTDARGSVILTVTPQCWILGHGHASFHTPQI